MARCVGNRKVKPVRIFLKHPTIQFFTGRMPFLPPNQQRQSTEGRKLLYKCITNYLVLQMQSKQIVFLKTAPN